MREITKTNRIEVVDALRGFAVMAIILVHNLEHFIFPIYPTDDPEWLMTLNEGVFRTVFCLFSGKAYAIFALLFGFTFYLQSDKQKLLGKDFGNRYLWRLVMLAGFATLNAAFFPAGDVLLLFVVVGLVLYVARNFSNKALLVTAVVFLLQPIEWMHYVWNLIDASHQMPDLQVGAMYDEIGEITKQGDFLQFLYYNITLGQKASLLWAVGAGRFLQTAGLFLLGFYLGRKQFFIHNDSNARLWAKVLCIAAIVFAPLTALHDMAMQRPEFVQQTVGTVLDMWQKLAFTLVLVTAFLMLYNSEVFRKLVGNLRYYGRMSLTNYITQSVLGALIYFPFGLYLAPYCGYALSLVVGIITFVGQVYFCKWWLSTHKQGPLESLWHKRTWMGVKH
ncbi:MAG: DUF418 domain-containing protein [Muribaculaceae bacterium]